MPRAWSQEAMARVSPSSSLVTIEIDIHQLQHRHDELSHTQGPASARGTQRSTYTRSAAWRLGAAVSLEGRLGELGDAGGYDGLRDGRRRRLRDGGCVEQSRGGAEYDTGDFRQMWLAVSSSAPVACVSWDAMLVRWCRL